MNRKGDWFLTFTGLQFWPLDPRPEEVCIRDIAHHLAHICRFNGACRVHYSVAQHSVMVADLLPDELKLWGLLHDATEAYVGDMVRPLKRNMPAFCSVEDLVWVAIREKFQLHLPGGEYWLPVAGTTPISIGAGQYIKHADNVALMTERRDLMVKSPKSWNTKEEPVPEPIIPLDPSAAEKLFLETFDDLIAFSKRP